MIEDSISYLLSHFFLYPTSIFEIPKDFNEIVFFMFWIWYERYWPSSTVSQRKIFTNRELKWKIFFGYDYWNQIERFDFYVKEIMSKTLGDLFLCKRIPRYRNYIGSLLYISRRILELLRLNQVRFVCSAWKWLSIIILCF